MLTIEKISRELLLYIVFLLILWVIFGFNLFYSYLFDNNSCSFNFKDYVVGINWMIGIANVIFTVGLLRFIYLYHSFDSVRNEEYRSTTLQDEYNNILTLLFLGLIPHFVNGILGLVIFFKSNLMRGEFRTCENDSGQILFLFDLVCFLWIGVFTVLKILQIIVIFLSGLIKTSKIYELQVNNDKEIQTDFNDVVIPVECKNGVNCIICMENQIGVLFEPCYHFCCCKDCSGKLEKKVCPCCKTNIGNIRNVYVSNI